MQTEQYFVTELRMGTEKHEKKCSISLGIPGEVYRQGAPVFVNRPSDSTFFDAEVDDPGAGASCRNALGIPVFSSQNPSEVIAVVVLFNSLAKTEHGLGDRDFEEEDAGKFG